MNADNDKETANAILHWYTVEKWTKCLPTVHLFDDSVVIVIKNMLRRRIIF